jgi:hypothetical protein
MFDLNSITKLQVFPDSFEKVLNQVQKNQKKKRRFSLYSKLSIAASLFFLTGSLLIGYIGVQAPPFGLTDDSLIEESEFLSWYSSLGEGDAIEETTSIWNEF